MVENAFELAFGSTMLLKKPFKFAALPLENEVNGEFESRKQFQFKIYFNFSLFSYLLLFFIVLLVIGFSLMAFLILVKSRV